MSPVRCPEDQMHLFSPEVMAAIASHPRVREPLPDLPFAPNRSIDVNRVCKVLGCSESVVTRLLKLNRLRYFKIRRDTGLGIHLRIHYDSLVEYCDSLRLIYCLPARRAPRAGGRVPDEALLPWPPDDNLSLKDVALKLDCSLTQASKLIDDGSVLAYKLIPGETSRSPYRISRDSFENYLRSL